MAITKWLEASGEILNLFNRSNFLSREHISRAGFDAGYQTRAEFSPAAELWCPNHVLSADLVGLAFLHQDALHVLGAVGDAAHRIVREVPALLHEVVLQAGQ